MNANPNPRNVEPPRNDAPRWAQRLLARLHPDDTLEEVEGDLKELYAYWLDRSGKTSATLRYLLNVISVLPPFVRRRKRKETYQSSTQYAAEQRVKEIGVRKVLGASIFNLTALLSKDFLKLVLIANGIAFPLAWWATSRWLEEFAYHIQVAWWVFAVAGMLSVVIALATVSYQAIKAALMNPVQSLRSE